MKIKQLTLKDFKGFGREARTWSFCGEWGEVNEITLIVGPNGSGKSTILQAIALLVACGSKNKLTPLVFNGLWPGFDLEHAGFNGRVPEAQAVVTFTESEMEATRAFCQKLKLRIPSLVLPAKNKEVEIFLRMSGGFELQNAAVRAQSPEELYQLHGYEYALQLNGGEENLAENLDKVGSIYWYHDLRKANSVARPSESEQNAIRADIDDEMLRRILQSWTAFHDMKNRPDFSLRPGQIDRFEKLGSLYQSVFPGRKLVGSTPHPSPDRQFDPPLFYFQDEKGNHYELSNMSAGERAIFPILVDFATWVMNNSIVLIDEIELHLHPPLQQALIRSLPKFGNNNQFIITSHSDCVVAVLPEANIIRLGHE